MSTTISRVHTHFGLHGDTIYLVVMVRMWNVPNSLSWLNTRFLASGAIWRGCGTPKEEVDHWVWLLRVYRPVPLPVHSLPPECGINVTTLPPKPASVLLFLFLCLPHNNRLFPFVTVSWNKAFPHKSPYQAITTASVA